MCLYFETGNFFDGSNLQIGGEIVSSGRLQGPDSGAHRALWRATFPNFGTWQLWGGNLPRAPDVLEGQCVMAQHLPSHANSESLLTRQSPDSSPQSLQRKPI